MIFSVETELEFLLRIILSIICGACIGFERETRLKTAGIRARTYSIVRLCINDDYFKIWLWRCFA